MTGEELLRSEAESFAARLTSLLNRTVTTGAEITVLVHEGQELAIVGPGSFERPTEIPPVPFSTARSAEERDLAKLWLKMFFRVGLDDERRHLTVEASMFGLCVNPETGRCVFRVEFERSKTRKQQAHVHIDGESAALGYAYAVAGRHPPALQNLHFPVGGRRFRPTLEDFIEFLRQERLVTLKQGGKKAIDESRADWEYRQTRAATRREPEAAAEQLRDMGWKVAPPGRY